MHIPICYVTVLLIWRLEKKKKNPVAGRMASTQCLRSVQLESFLMGVLIEPALKAQINIIRAH